MPLVGRSLLLLLTPLLLLACNRPLPEQTPARPGNSGADCRLVPHDNGETRICGQPQQPVALDPHSLDLFLALEAQPIGYAEEARARIGPMVLGAPMEQIKYLGQRLTSPPVNIGSRTEPSLEIITRLKPDLIIGENFNQLSYTRLSQIAPTLLLSGSARDAWQHNLKRLGQALGREEQAQQVIEQHRQRLAATKADLQLTGPEARVLLLGFSGLSEIEIFTGDSYPGGLLQDLGFELILPPELEASDNYRSISLETLPFLDAPQIIVMASGTNTVENARAQWQQHPILRSLAANQANRVYFADYQLWNRIRGPIAAELVIEQVRKWFLNSRSTGG